MQRLARFAWFVLGYNVAVILWGAYVRATGSGAGCGEHWPLCNGVIIPRTPTTATLIEFSHRLTSGLALLAVVALLVWVWRACAPGHPARRGAVWTVFFMLTEAAVGAGLVLFQLVADNATMARALFMAVHLLNTFILLAWLALTAWWLSGGAALRPREKPGTAVALLVLSLGLLLTGTSGAVAALGDTLFPHGSLSAALEADLSPTSHLLIRLRLLHPFFAVIASVALMFAAARLARGRGPSAMRTARIVAIASGAQLALGALNVALLAPIWMQMVHLFVADAIWIAFVLLAASALGRAPVPGHGVPSPLSLVPRHGSRVPRPGSRVPGPTTRDQRPRTHDQGPVTGDQGRGTDVSYHDVRPTALMRPHPRRLVSALALLLVAIAARASMAERPPQALSTQPVNFVRDIQPILQASCYKCHSASAKVRGGLRLDDRDAAMRGGESGPVLVPGRSADSLIVRRILGLDGDDPMPKEGDPLTPAQVALIRAWIDQGAVWPASPAPVAPASAPQHWAYVKPAAPPLPPVRDGKWIVNDIDRFVLARLEKEGLTPSPEAPLETLVRRVFLDLVGLPPSVEEVDAVVADAASSTRAAAYERLVDRLLASPHYGERWARPWLDLARYADSNGYEKDRPRVMWKYRDWVIDALNADMPYDQFTIEQIAGDMLPKATTAQRIATGFHRNTLLNQEGGIDVEEARWETLVDRVNTTATVWLGSTIGCAQCHDHKYDPFTQRDYYHLLAFFENVEYTIASGGDRFVVEPQLDLPTPEQEVRRKALQSNIDALNAELRAETPARAAAQDKWEQAVLAAERVWTPLTIVRFESNADSTHEPLDDGSILVTGANPGDNVYTIVADAPLAGIRAVRVEALPDPRLPQRGPGRNHYGNFVLNGFDVSIDGAFVAFTSVRVDDGSGSGSIENFHSTSDGSSYAPRGWIIDATRDPAGRVRRQAVFVAEQPFGTAPTTQLTIALRHTGSPVGQSIGRFRVSVSAAPQPFRVLEVPARLRPALLVPKAQRTPEQQRDLTAQFRNVASALKPTRDRIAALQKELRDLGIVTAMVMKEKPSHDRPSTFIRRRGSFLDTGDKVYAGVPAVLHAMPDEAMPNRLGLARWLVSRDNPLTARVAVNRAWEQFFGRGLVETSEDFGTQGAAPSHADLLDWLAVKFMDEGWRMKALHRSIVMSAAYRQTSAISQMLAQRDPYNRLLARGPRFRVEAEMVRDITLAASGLLSRKTGGPSVFPPQPDGIWQVPYSNDRWTLSTGDDRYRRGLYTFLRRSAPYPAFLTMDATSRESCTVRRVRTNTPLQALTLLNDEAFFEAARALARRMMDGRAAAADRATYGFRLCVARTPNQAEIDQVVAAFNLHVEHFRRNPERARQVIGGSAAEDSDAAERAAWTLVANALLNLDETISKE